MKKIAFSIAALAVAFSYSFAGAANYSITPSLTMGSTGPEVVELQQMLVAKGYLVMPVGVPMGYFGTLTQNAVKALQLANNIAPAAGYYGPLTAGVVNSWSMTAGPVGPSSPSSLSGGDGDFKDFDVLGSPNNKDVDEGKTVNVLGFEFEADDSDLLVERVDLIASSSNNNESKPWKVIDEIALIVDGDEVASIDASDEDMWDEQDEFDGEDAESYRLRIEDVDLVVEEGETVKVYVAVTASDDVDSDETGEWLIAIDDDGVRALNAEGINVYEGSQSDEKTFSIEVADVGELDITVDDDENEDEEVEVSEDDTTDGVTIYTAQVESTDGDNNIDEVTVELATTSSSVGDLSDLIETLYLFIDGDEVGSESVSGADTDSVTFDDLDFDLEEDEEVDFVVKADINEQGDDEENYEDGAGVQVTDMSIDFTDSQDDDFTETSGVAGGEITFSLDALKVELSSTPSAQSPVSNDEARGRFYVEFKVTAPDESDIYISKGATTSTTVSAGEGAEFIVVDGSGNTVSATTTVSSNLLTKVSGGSETGGRYKISKGNTATFKLDVIVDNTGAESARTLGIQLTGVNYKAGTNAVADTQFNANLDEDFRSDTANLSTSNTD